MEGLERNGRRVMEGSCPTFLNVPTSLRLYDASAFSSSRLTIEIVICDVSVNGKRPREQFIRGVSSMRCTTRMRTDRRRRWLPFLSGYTSWGGGRVKGRATPEVIGRSGQRAAIVNETHRSHQMLTSDWRWGRASRARFCVRRSRHLACCVLLGHVTASACPG